MKRQLFGTVLVIASGLLSAANATSRTPLNLPVASSGGQSTGKVWSHRTLGSAADENTVEGFREVLSLGACGVEVDIRYDRVENRLFVQSEEFNLENRYSSLTLATLLKSVPPKSSIWLDFWNLKDLERGDVARAVQQLEAEVGDAKLWHTILVESRNAARLHSLPDYLCKILWIETAPPDDYAVSHRKHIAELSKALTAYHWSGASAISMDYRQYDATVAEMFANVPIALFTINDPDDLRKASSDPNVKIILSDKPFYGLTCMPAESNTGKGG